MYAGGISRSVSLSLSLSVSVLSYLMYVVPTAGHRNTPLFVLCPAGLRGGIHRDERRRLHSDCAGGESVEAL